MTYEPLVSIVIPAYNRIKEPVELVDSLINTNQYKNIEITLVDDASPNVNYMKLFQNLPDGFILRIIRNNEELWLAASRNVGIKVSKGEFIFLIDDDNTVGKNTIRELVNFLLSNATAGIAAPVAFYFSDKTRILDGGGKKILPIGLTLPLFLNRTHNMSVQPYEVGEVSNAFMVRRNLFDCIGLFDEENFPIENDEADLCYRTRKAGLRVFIVPSARVWHKHSRISVLNELRLRNARKAYYVGRNRVLICKKNLKMQYAVFVMFGIPLFCCMYVLWPLLATLIHNDKRFECIHNIIKGIAHGLLYNKDRLRNRYEK